MHPLAKAHTKYLWVNIIAVTAEEIPSMISADCSAVSPFSLWTTKDLTGSMYLTSPFKSPESELYISLM